MVKCEKCAKSWRVVEPDSCVFREAPFEIGRQCRGLRWISRKNECKGNAILRVSALRQPKGRCCGFSGGGRFSQETLAQRSSSLVHSRSLRLGRLLGQVHGMLRLPYRLLHVTHICGSE